MWPVAKLTPNALNPRGEIDSRSVEDLVASIREHGVLEPLIVTPEGVVVAGHRRLLAAQLAGCTTVPAIARALLPQVQLEIMLVENVQREALNPLQEARGYQRLIDTGCTRAVVARRVGVPPARIDGRLLILRLAPAVQELYGRDALPVTLAPVLAAVPDGERQARLAMLAASRGLPVHQIESLVRRGQRAAAAARDPGTAAATAPPAGIPPRTLGPDRDLALRLLAREPARQISFTRLFAVMDAVCCACGTHDVAPDLCRECPLPKLVILLALPHDKVRALAEERPTRLSGPSAQPGGSQRAGKTASAA
jgi:ParB family chromosome partitioning protein